jgi:hypothetical protein
LLLHKSTWRDDVQHIVVLALAGGIAILGGWRIVP